MAGAKGASWRKKPPTRGPDPDAYRAFFEGAPFGLFRTRPDGTILDANAAALQIFGYPDLRAFREVNAQVVYADPAERVAFFLGLTPGETRTRIIRMKRRDGSIRSIRNTVHLVAEPGGGPGFLEGILEDVTEQLRVVDDLRRSQDVLRSLMESSPLPIYFLDVEGRVLDWNPAAERLYGWSAEEVMGRPLPTIREEQQGEYDELRGRVMAGGVLDGMEVRRWRKDGTPLTLNVWVGPLRDRAGRVTALSVVAENVTERKRLAEQLRLAQRMESVGRLAGGVAHDFNNVLTAILGSTDYLQGLLDPAHPGQQELLEIDLAARRAGGLIRQLLAFSRRQVLAPQVLDPNELIRHLERMLSRLLGEGVRCRTLLADGAGPIIADRGQLEQVIINLAVNARDAMPEGGSLTIETSDVELDAGFATTHPVSPGPYTVISVSDTGVGIVPELQQHIFEPFFTTKGPGEGTGLGLSTAYGIVKQSGGHLLVQSEPGHGATFRVYLPRVAAAVAEPSASVAVPDSLIGSETIVVVEDEPALRRVVERTLGPLGYRLIMAGDALEAGTRIEAHPGAVDLLVTDVVMPGLSGRELADQLRRDRPGLRVLFLSGYTEDAVIRHGVHPPGHDFLQKPFTPTELARKVREILDR